MDNSNKIGATLLFVVIIIFVIGGYVLTHRIVTNKNVKPTNSNKVETDLRVDKTKDFVYYENGSDFFEPEDIEKVDAILNFANLKELNDSLHNEISQMYETSVVKITDASIPDGTEYINNDLGYYSFKYRNYMDIKYGKYVSLVVMDYDYDIINTSKITNIKSYVVDKNTGNLITSEELLKSFNVDENHVIELIKKRLDNSQVLDGETQIIDINKTIEDIKNTDYNSGTKALSVSKNGNLVINFIVKSNKVNYNDIIEYI